MGTYCYRIVGFMSNVVGLLTWSWVNFDWLGNYPPKRVDFAWSILPPLRERVEYGVIHMVHRFGDGSEYGTLRLGHRGL